MSYGEAPQEASSDSGAKQLRSALQRKGNENNCHRVRGAGEDQVSTATSPGYFFPAVYKIPVDGF